MSDSCLICSEPLTVKSTGEYHGKCLEKLFGSAVSPRLPYSLDSLENLAAEVVRTHAAAVTGVQKKLSLSLEEDKSGKGQLTFVGLWGNFILKPPVHEYEQLPENELLTMNLAGKIGIDTVPHGLVRLTSGEAAYVTRRVDRIHRAGHYSVDDWEKIPMEDMCQLTERLTEHKYRGSLEQVGKVILKYCTNRIFDALRFYELILFCFLTGNGDMHLKNFSLITSKNGISLAPAYDLLNTRLVISDRDDPDDSALTLDGRRRRLEKKNFDNLADKLELTSRQRDNVYKRFARKKEDILGMIGISRLSLELREQYEAIFRSRWDRLF